LLLSQLIIFVIENFNLSSLDKIHFFDAGLIRDDSLCRLINSAIKINNELIDEASFTFFEKMIETSFKLFKLECLENEFSLHSWGHKLIKLELLNNEIIIVKESLIDVIFNIIIKIRLNVKWLV
jgi:hypothetical protein